MRILVFTRHFQVQNALTTWIYRRCSLKRISPIPYTPSRKSLILKSVPFFIGPHSSHKTTKTLNLVTFLLAPIRGCARISFKGGVMLKSFGVIVRQARVQRGMTQGQVAEIVGVSRGTILKIESGKCGKIPPMLCLLLGVEAPKRATPDHLKAFREAFHLTTKKAASLVGVSSQTWAYWEGGGALRGIPYHVLPKLRQIASELRQENEAC